ncbi:MAG: hypothetical protein O3C60_17990 [Planctomycetota bacterium]|nr:hypothetical protein [Planctomycetota bacterium]
MKDWYTKRTHSEGTDDWLRILQLCNWGVGASGTEKLPYVGFEGETRQYLAPGGDWAEEPLVASFVHEMEPVLQLIENASKHPKPVRFSLIIDGFATPLPQLQEARSVMRLLNLDFDYAYYHQDTQRALRDLQLMDATIDAFDSREIIVSNLINLALRSMRMGAIRRSLTNSIWTAEELAHLRESVASPDPLAERWRDVMMGERAFGLAAIESLRRNETTLSEFDDSAMANLIPPTPSVQRQLLECYDRAVHLPIEDGLTKSRVTAEEIDRMVHDASGGSASVWIGLVFPAVTAYFGAAMKAESDRRWTQTAIALRQYKSQNGDWPTRLEDLESLGLRFDDYSLANGGMFGYEVDGKIAYLWTTDSKSVYESTVGPTRPTEENAETNGTKNDSLWHLLELR